MILKQKNIYLFILLLFRETKTAKFISLELFLFGVQLLRSLSSAHRKRKNKVKQNASINTLLLVLWSLFHVFWSNKNGMQFYRTIKRRLVFFISLKFVHIPFALVLSSSSSWAWAHLITAAYIELTLVVTTLSFSSVLSRLAKKLRNHTQTLNGSFNWLFKLGKQLGLQLLPLTVSEMRFHPLIQNLVWFRMSCDYGWII